MLDAIAILFLSAWALATVLVLVPPLAGMIRAADVLQLLPEWRFFAPRPGRSDYFLLYRGFAADGKATPWREINLCRDRGFHNALWNPCRRERKAWIDIVAELLEAARRGSTPAAQAGIPYLALLQRVTFEAKTSGAGTAVQFLVVSRDGMAGTIEMEPTFMSAVHSL